jgi:hypothetical protein
VTVCVPDPLTPIVRPCALDAFHPLTFPLNCTHTAPSELKLETPAPPQVVVKTVAPAAHPPPVHVPLTHVDPSVHAVPHPPQFPLSVCSLTQAPLHSE